MYSITDNDWLLMPSSIVDVTKDSRALIPFKTPFHKMGMINHNMVQQLLSYQPY